MRKSTLALAIVALMVPLSGCLSGNSDVQNVDDEPMAPQFTMGTMPSGENARDYIESYIMTHPFRVGGQFESYMQEARDDLVAIMEETGHYVMRHDYDGGQNILVIQNGTTNPDQWVVLSAHYDTVGVGGIGPTVYGAWDDGAGTAVLMELAHAWADWEFPFTVVYAFFDGEEKGLRGSGAFVEDFWQDGEHDIVANINTDPPGLNYPCGDQTGLFPVKIINNMAKVEAGNLPRYTWLYDAVEYGLNMSEVPMEVRDYTAGIPIATAAGVGLRGTSDHASFDAVDVANVFLGGVPATIVNGDANDNTAAVLTYSFHTPLDTLQQMEARCTVGTLSEGLHTISTMFSYTVAHMAETGVPDEL